MRYSAFYMEFLFSIHISSCEPLITNDNVAGTDPSRTETEWKLLQGQLREFERTWMAAKPNNPDMLAFPFPPRAKGTAELEEQRRAINCYCIEQTQTDAHTHAWSDVEHIIVNYLRRCKGCKNRIQAAIFPVPSVNCTLTNEFHSGHALFPVRRRLTHQFTCPGSFGVFAFKLVKAVEKLVAGEGRGKIREGDVTHDCFAPFPLRPICCHHFPTIFLVFSLQPRDACSVR